MIETVGQFGRFMLSGGASALADLGTYTLLSNVGGIHPALANLVSRPLGGVVSFLLNKHWTFGNRGQASGHVQALRYGVVWIMSFTISESLVWALYRFLSSDPIAAKLAAEAAAGIFTFLCHRLWTFR